MYEGNGASALPRWPTNTVSWSVLGTIGQIPNLHGIGKRAGQAQPVKKVPGVHADEDEEDRTCLQDG